MPIVAWTLSFAKNADSSLNLGRDESSRFPAYWLCLKVVGSFETRNRHTNRLVPLIHDDLTDLVLTERKRNPPSREGFVNTFFGPNQLLLPGPPRQEGPFSYDQVSGQRFGIIEDIK